MKLVLVLALSVALSGIALVATAEPASACALSNCTPCDVEWYYWFHIDTFEGGIAVDRPVVDCGL